MNDSIHKIAAFTTNSWESPLAVLRIVGPARFNEIDILSQESPEEDPAGIISQADLVLIQRDFPRYQEVTKQIVTKAHKEQKPLVFDIDDLIFELPENHPDRISHYYNQALIPMIEMLLDANLVTTSTPALYAYLSQFNDKVEILPNYLNDQIWKLCHPEHKSGQSSVVIGYMGSDSHLADIVSIESAILNILDKYQDRVDFRFLGARPPKSLRNNPSVMWMPTRTLQYARFAADFLKQHYDIFIAPLEDNMFNRCKSQIKFLEYGSTGTPGIYSNLETYSCVVRHGENGFLASTVEEWEEFLSILIENPDLRIKMATEAQNTIRQDWLLSQHKAEWVRSWTHSLSLVNTPNTQRVPAIEKIIQLTKTVQEQPQEKGYLNREGGFSQRELREEIEIQRKVIRQQKQTIRELKLELENIYQSNVWKLAQRLVRLHSKVFPSEKGSTSSQAHAQGKQLPPTNDSQPTPRVKNRQYDIQTSINDVDIIVLPIINWGFRFQRPQQLSQQLAVNGHRVFYIDTKFSTNTGLQVNNISENLYEVQLSSDQALRIYKDALTDELTDQFIHQFETLKENYYTQKAVLLIELPFWTPLALQLRNKYHWKIIYDCMDYHEGFESNSVEMLSLEKTLSSRSNAVLTTSHILFDLKAKQNPNCYLLPNGADFAHFHGGLVEIAEQRPNIENPIIGYYGAIADWFDTHLIRSLAEARPGWNFILIGNTQYADITPLQGLPNIKLKGEVPYHELPQHLNPFNVAIIPFRKNPLTQATNPVKLFEYLSAGKAVVATDLNELRYYSEYVRLASTPDEWLEAIETALKDYSPVHVQERINFARKNTWEIRLKELQKIIASLNE
jgi:glycosyltransferase involved in cell wall biosynthesis